MKLSYLIGAHAYAVIQLDNGRKIDIRLTHGKSAAASLREYAEDKRADAARAAEMADIAEQAAEIAERNASLAEMGAKAQRAARNEA